MRYILALMIALPLLAVSPEAEAGLVEDLRSGKSDVKTAQPSTAIAAFKMVREQKPAPDYKAVVITRNIYGKIWQDVDLVFVPIAFRKPFVRQFHPYDDDAQTVALFPYSDEWRYILFRMIGACLRWLVSPQRVVSDASYLASFPNHDVPARRSPLDHWVPAYLRLLRDVPAAPVKLPEGDRRLVANALQRAAGRKTKLCCLYLRLRATKKHPDAFLRSGGDVERYRRVLCFAYLDGIIWF